MVANQYRRIIDRRAAIKVNAAVGDNLDSLTGGRHRHQLIGMVVQDTLDIGTRFIDRRVHRRLAVGLAKTFELISLGVNDDQIAQCNFPRRHMRRAQYSAVGQARGKMTVAVEHALFLQYLAR